MDLLFGLKRLENKTDTCVLVEKMEPPLEDKIAFFRTIQGLQRVRPRSGGDGGRDYNNVDDNDQLEGEEEQEHRSRCAAFRRQAASASSSSARAAVTIPATQAASMYSKTSNPLRPSASQQSSDGDVEIISVTPLPRQAQPGINNKRRTTTDNTPSRKAGASSSLNTATRDLNKRRATHPLARVLNNDTSPTSQSRPNTATTAPPPRSTGASAVMAASASSASSSAKRKPGKDAIKLVPANRQVFRGLSFYYVPNNDINAVRKARIAKAREHGAVWARSFTADRPTHIIVDKALGYDIVAAEPGWQDYKDILTSATVAAGTNVETIVVNEEYPLHCISYRKLVNPNQPQYLVKCAPAPIPESETIPATAVSSSASAVLPQQEPSSFAATDAASEVSLKLKPKHSNTARWDWVPPDNTPPRSEEPSAQESSAGQSRLPQSQVSSSAQSVIEVTAVSSTYDDLDDVTHVSETILPADRTTLGESSSVAGADDEGDELLECIRDIRSNTDEVSYLLNTASTEDEEDTDSSSDRQTTKGSETSVEAGSSTSALPQRTTRSTASRPAGMVNPRKGAWQDHFACMRAGAQGAGADNPNSRTIELLQQMLNHNEQINDQWRTMSYKKAIAALKRHPVKITTAEQARDVVGIGQSIGEKIEEIVQTDSLRKLEFVQNDSQFRTLQLFLKVYGVGIRKAQEWMAKGHQSLEDVVKHEQLSAGQKIGIDHFDELNARIPRTEVTALGEFVMVVAAEIDPAVEFVISGSYRRGSQLSGDIDLVVTKKGTSSTEALVPFLHELVDKLYDVGFLTATLSSLSAEVKQGHGSKWHGCCVLPRSAATRLTEQAHNQESTTGKPKSKEATTWQPIWRRIDFLLVPDTELGAAMIYFTGDDIFNRSLRLLAGKKGMRLNQRGLYKDVLRGPKRVKLTEGELVESRDERKIFEVLGVKWREPTERWCQ